MDREEETIQDIVLACVTYTGRTEEDLLADYERRCKRKRIIPLIGQVKSALKALHKAGKIKIVGVQGHRLCCKVRESKPSLLFPGDDPGQFPAEPLATPLKPGQVAPKLAGPMLADIAAFIAAFERDIGRAPTRAEVGAARDELAARQP
jgi:hypothetical protein